MQPFYARLNSYFKQVAAVLQGQAAAASVFPNSIDVGDHRERLYLEFLRAHLPGSAHVRQGGFLFGLDGSESKQIDVIVINNYALRFDFVNSGSIAKAFACVEGSIAAASLKSNLSGDEFEDAFLNLASIPPMGSLQGRKSQHLNIENYDNWPFKIVYAPVGATSATIMERFESIVQRHPAIPQARWPDLVHVAGRYAIVKSPNRFVLPDGSLSEPNVPQLVEGADADIQGLVWAVLEIQKLTTSSSQILFYYDDLLSRVADAGT